MNTTKNIQVTQAAFYYLLAWYRNTFKQLSSAVQNALMMPTFLSKSPLTMFYISSVVLKIKYGTEEVHILPLCINHTWHFILSATTQRRLGDIPCVRSWASSLTFMSIYLHCSSLYSCNHLFIHVFVLLKTVSGIKEKKKMGKSWCKKSEITSIHRQQKWMTTSRSCWH